MANPLQCKAYATLSERAQQACFSGRYGSCTASSGIQELRVQQRLRRCSWRGTRRICAVGLGDGGQDLVSSTKRPEDAFRNGALRLQNLLSGVGNGEEELIDNVLELEPPESKLLLAMIAAGSVMGAACFLCWLAGNDPLGGASLSLDSLRATLVGALASIPLVMMTFLVWGKYMQAGFVPVDEIQNAKLRSYEPVISNMSNMQIAVLLAAETTASMVIALPAALGGMLYCFNSFAEVGRDVGFFTPANLPVAAAVSITAFLASATQAAELAVSDAEYEQIRDAVENSDRYYRVMAMGKNSTAFTAAEASTAFRTVALTWLARRRLAARLAAVLAGAEIAYLGLLWLQVDDLTAPLVASLIGGAVEFTFLRQRINTKQQNAAAKQIDQP